MVTKISRRTACQLIAGALPTLKLRAAQHPSSPGIEIEPGPFTGTRESLSKYEIPEWFRDAKFGIWAHWGPQSAAEAGDWYARNMYMQGSDQYLHHVATYGHPSKFGYKDTIPPGKPSSSTPLPHRPLQESRREVLHEHGRAPRQLRHVELRPSALECRE